MPKDEQGCARSLVQTRFSNPGFGRAPLVTLEVGDSTYFDSKMGHAIVSLGKEDAEVIWICTGIAALS